MKEDVAFDPIFVGLFGTVGVVFGAQGVADLLHELFGGVRRFLGVGWHCISCVGGAKIWR